jgi:hypothetical protein
MYSAIPPLFSSHKKPRSNNLVHLLAPIEAADGKAAHESRDAPKPVQILDFLTGDHDVHSVIGQYQPPQPLESERKEKERTKLTPTCHK